MIIFIILITCLVYITSDIYYDVKKSKNFSSFTQEKREAAAHFYI